MAQPQSDRTTSHSGQTLQQAPIEIIIIAGSLESQHQWPRVSAELRPNASLYDVIEGLVAPRTMLKFYEKIAAPAPFAGSPKDPLMLLRPLSDTAQLPLHLYALPVVPLSALPPWPQLTPRSAEPANSDLDRQNEEKLQSLRTSPPVPSSPPSAELNKRISLWAGNIVALEVDAIVNSANEALLGGGGVDGIIHFVAGAALKKVCHDMPGPLLYKTPSGAEMRVRCGAGEAKLTAGFGLPAKFILHSVGPYLDEGGKTQPQVLERCYRSCMDLALATHIRTVVFPRISTAYYGFPIYEAALIALRAVRSWLEKHPNSIDRVIFATGPNPGDRAAELMHIAAHECFPAA